MHVLGTRIRIVLDPFCRCAYIWQVGCRVILFRLAFQGHTAPENVNKKATHTNMDGPVVYCFEKYGFGGHVYLRVSTLTSPVLEWLNLSHDSPHPQDLSEKNPTNRDHLRISAADFPCSEQKKAAGNYPSGIECFGFVPISGRNKCRILRHQIRV